MTDRLWYEINIPYFSFEKAGINIDLGHGKLETGVTSKVEYVRVASKALFLTI